MFRKCLVCIVLGGLLQQVANGLAISKSQASSINSVETLVGINSSSSSSNKTAITTATAISGPPRPQQEVISNAAAAQAASGNSDTNNPVPDNRRPIWNLAHMVNSIKELDYRLGKGANAVEADITFGREGDPLYTYHGPPCDCWRHCHQQEDFEEYLRYVREIAIDELDGVGKNLSLLFLDLKLDHLDLKGKARAGAKLAKSIAQNLFLDRPSPSVITRNHNHNLIAATETSPAAAPKKLLRLILSVNHVSDIELVYNFLHFMEENNVTHLMGRIGFDVGMNDDLQQIDSMWKPYGNRLNLWQGDGFTNCFSPFYNLERLSKAIVRRDSDDGYPRKVYHWTIDMHDRMRDSLRMGVDAIMTNHPERLVAILQEPEMVPSYRLASLADDPFKKITSSRTMAATSSRASELARRQRSAAPTSAGGGGGGGFIAGLLDVIASWYAYMKEIPFLSFPTTSRFLPKANRRQHKQDDQQAKSGQPLDTAASRAAAAAAPPELPIGDNSSSSSSPLNSTQLSERISISDSADAAAAAALVTGAAAAAAGSEPAGAAYEGPKWYTSLVSNMLVSFMKIALPAPSTS